MFSFLIRLWKKIFKAKQVKEAIAYFVPSLKTFCLKDKKNGHVIVVTGLNSLDVLAKYGDKYDLIGKKIEGEY